MHKSLCSAYSEASCCWNRRRAVGLSKFDAVKDDTSFDVSSIDADDDETCSEELRPQGMQLQGGQFLTTANCFKYLLDTDLTTVYDFLPTGVKDNMCFLVKHYAARKYWDDCGAWKGSHDKKTYNLPGSFTEIRKPSGGPYCEHRRVDGKMTEVPMNLQPTQVYIMHRLYSKLCRDDSYQRRITYVDGGDFYLAEYIGSFPDSVTAAHGNAKHHQSEYVRTHPQVFADIESAIHSKKKVRQTYNDLTKNVTVENMVPRYRKQVRFFILCSVGLSCV